MLSYWPLVGLQRQLCTAHSGPIFSPYRDRKMHEILGNSAFLSNFGPFWSFWEFSNISDPFRLYFTILKQLWTNFWDLWMLLDQFWTHIDHNRPILIKLWAFLDYIELFLINWTNSRWFGSIQNFPNLCVWDHCAVSTWPQ